MDLMDSENIEFIHDKKNKELIIRDTDTGKEIRYSEYFLKSIEIDEPCVLYKIFTYNGSVSFEKITSKDINLAEEILDY